MAVRFSIEPLPLETAYEFRISRIGSKTYENLVFAAEVGKWTGRGEAAPREFYGEDLPKAREALERFVREADDLPSRFEDLVRAEDDAAGLRVLEGILVRYDEVGRDLAGRTALDGCLYDLLGKARGKPLCRIVGADPAKMPPTSFTIGIAGVEETRKKVAEAKGFRVLKIKLGTDRDAETMRTIRSLTSLPLRVDANGGWSLALARERLRWLADLGVEFVEQPLPAGALDDLARLHENAPLPIFADEDCKVASDVETLAGRCDGVNVKLAKTGGIREALRTISVARGASLKLMLGCMIESSLGIAAAAHVAPLVDHVDLDGHLLLARDPYEGLGFADGRIVLPDRPGLGVAVRNPTQNGGTRATAG
jgi:L-alanine-DL-glutamate epimerase-like enolase superfamily enzyme